MAKLVFLDSEPLGLASKQSGKPDADACRSWLSAIELAGALVLIPEIVDYEVRRELMRVGATAGLRRLDALLGRFTLLPLAQPAIVRAAELWRKSAKSDRRPPTRMPSMPTQSLPARHSRRLARGTPSLSPRRTFAILADSQESMLGCGKRSLERWVQRTTFLHKIRSSDSEWHTVRDCRPEA